jgi:hypothetical protein
MLQFITTTIYKIPFLCTPVTPVVSYLSTGLAGCSVDQGNSRGARKLTRTPGVIKKYIYIMFLNNDVLKLYYFIKIFHYVLFIYILDAIYYLIYHKYFPIFKISIQKSEQPKWTRTHQENDMVTCGSVSSEGPTRVEIRSEHNLLTWLSLFVLWCYLLIKKR